MYLSAKLHASVNFCYFHTTKQRHIFIPIQAESDMGEAIQINASEIIYAYMSRYSVLVFPLLHQCHILY